MKVLLINNDKGWSGGQEHLKDLTAELLRLGAEVQFVVRAGSISDGRFRDMGVPVLALPGHGIRDIKALFQLVRLFRRERFDIVSINREHDLFLTALALCLAFPFRRPGKLMMSYHTTTSRRQLLIGRVDGVLCISEHVRTRLLLGNPAVASKTSIVYHGIALGDPPAADKFDRNRRRRYFSKEGFPLIGMVGEFWKNQGELVGMIPLLKEKFPSIKIVFVGDNTDKGLVDPVINLIRSLGVEDAVIFTGRVPRERIPDIFYDFDLSVTTHRNEGFGIVHLESLVAGTPIVTFDEGGMVDIFKGEDIGRVVSGGAVEFVAAVTDLLENDEERFRLGRNGYELMVRQYSLAAMGRRYMEYYENLLSEKGSC
jgi:glycosyltransferase involved in cell wall biosynthesis